MKKTLLYSTLLMLATFSSLSFADVPNQVSLHYTGTVISQPCDVSIGSTTTLDMGDLDITTLSAKGATSPWLNYNIHFGHCDVSTVITIGSSPANPFDGYENRVFNVYDSQSKLLNNIGLQVMVTVNGSDINMVDKYAMSGWWLPILPEQRTGGDATSYNLPIKFSFKNVNGVVPQSGKITGVYVLSIEYQ